MRPITTSFDLFDRRQKLRYKTKKAHSMIVRAARFLFLFSRSSIMDIFLRVFCAEAAALPEILAFPFLALSFVLPFLHLIVSRYNTLNRRRRVSQRDSIFTELGSMCGPFDLSSPAHTLRRNFLWLLLFAMHIILTVLDTVLLCIRIHSSRYIPLPAVLCSTHDSYHDRSYRTHSVTFRNLFRLFSSVDDFVKFLFEYI